MHPINQGLMRRPCSRGTPCPTRPPTAQVGDTGDTLNMVLLAQSWLATWLWKKKKKKRESPGIASTRESRTGCPRRTPRLTRSTSGPISGWEPRGKPRCWGHRCHRTPRGNHWDPKSPAAPLGASPQREHPFVCAHPRARGLLARPRLVSPPHHGAPADSDPPGTLPRARLAAPPGPAQLRQPQTRAVVGLWALIMRTGAPAPPEIRGTVPVRMCRVPPAPQG